MGHSVRAFCIAFFAFFISLVVSPLYAKNASMQEVSEDYLRYTSTGRSDTLITLSLYGSKGSARVSQNANGTFNCLVSGLGISDDNAHPSVRLEQKGKLIHESTHCLVVPYTHTTEGDQNDPLARISNDLVILMAESASDARAIIEIYRKDGISEANAYASLLLAYRSKAKDVEHSTAEAITLAREIVTHDTKRVQTDADAFYTALHIARWSAESTVRRILEENAHDDMMSSPQVIATLTTMDATVEDAVAAFKNGRYQNSAATIRTNYEGKAPGDTHIFAGSDGTVRTEATIGLEHAHELIELRTLIDSSTTPEQLLALDALRKYGLLSKNNLLDTQILFVRWINAFAHSDAAKRKAVCKVIAKVITDTHEVEGVGALYDKVTYALQRAFD